MATTNKTVSEKLTKIMANANRNRREQAKLRSVGNDAWNDQERLESESVTEKQIEMLDKFGVVFDRRPLSEGGTLSRWNAMQLLDEALKAAKERRERARAEPATQKQIEALISFNCEPDDLSGLTRGEASDLIRNFIRPLRASKRA
jgi:hypothetical protein